MKRQMVDMLADLIKLSSDPNADKHEILDYLQSFADSLKMRSSVYGDPSAPALLSEYGQGGVVLAGHLDTPPVGDGWSFSQSQFTAGRMYGRGAADMKGTVVAMLSAVSDLVTRKVPCVLAITTDEETTMNGAQALCKTLALRRAKAVVVGEPTGLRTGYAEKGVLDLSIETRGRSAHGAMPQLGENAVVKLMRLLRALETFRGRVAHPELGTVTVNVGTFHGGNRVNVVPSRASAEVDIRFPPPYTPDELQREVEEHLKRIKTPFTLRRLVSLPSLQADPQSEHIRIFKEVSGSELAVLVHASEAVHYVTVNPRVVIYGAGDEDLSHQANEYVKMEAVVRAAESYKKFAQRMASMRSPAGKG
ncbi:MAG: M20 family metallopeptidase [Euryarchaeota archaeon]|nr:M20 family metallopeptidase [Euryarchaeota archaeon]MDE1835764.1 M20 family metallopeptidase [Euryarchaeota archaeon]MDE1881532.1 M20 family metallopeptidase [Euryarchaeota archaeon]MDE2043955.1 M20 family metallopeptidase [Thermoplasmata archaeon]